MSDVAAELREIAAAQVTLGQRLAALATQVTTPAPGPDTGTGTGTPPVGDIPADANVVQIGTARYPLAAINPTPANNPLGFQSSSWAGRGPDQLIIGRPPWSRTGTNEHGIEVAVRAGRVSGPASEGRAGGIAIPSDGYVLSAHGAAAKWVKEHAAAGAVVEVLHVDQPVPTPGTPATTPTGDRTLAVYLMDGVGRISQVPDNVNQVRVAFLQRGGLTEWGGDSPAKTAADLTAWRAARPGRRVLVSVGGAGGQVDVAAVAGQLREVAARFPVDGVDWDLEGGSLPVAQVVAASKVMADVAGRVPDLALGRDGWTTSFVPPGGPPVGVYLDAAKQCKAAGLTVQFGQQLYDAEVSQSAAIGATQRAVDALGAESVLIGMMVAADAKHWTVDQCEANMRAVAQRWPGIGGAYLWESARAGTADWARRVGAVLGL